jgi:hypothetical protein
MAAIIMVREEHQQKALDRLRAADSARSRSRD